MSYPRVAFLTDSYHEVNGVAHTSRCFEAYAIDNGLPFLCVRAGDETVTGHNGSVETLDLKRGPISFGIDRRQRHDLALWRHHKVLANAFRSFKPDLVHITGPSDVGQLGAYVAYKLRIPLVASWHTDLHKFLAMRVERKFAFAPEKLRKATVDMIEHRALDALVRFYKIPRGILAPNQETIDLLKERTGKPVYPMHRGIDTGLFNPSRRNTTSELFTLGYVGRLTPEKNVRLLVEIERALIAAGRTNFRFLIVGDGYERPWLEKNLTRAEFTGFLTGEALATAYANMDLFLFPSRTDTFGNVVLEALASGTPAVVTGEGGPKFLVKQDVTGAIAADKTEFIRAVIGLMDSAETQANMRTEARKHACLNSWERVFDLVYRAYAGCLNRTLPMQFSGAYAR